MTRVLLVPHPTRLDAIELMSKASRFLREKGATPLCAAPDSIRVGNELGIDQFEGGEVDLVVTLGGDGTVLRALQLIDGRETPIMAVNAGNLGYLTEFAPEDLLSVLDRWLAGGDFFKDDRMLLEVQFVKNGSLMRRYALNEAVVEKRESGHTVRVRVEIDGEVFTAFVADGVIIATPTGSTAYAFSARGPIMSPRQHAVLVTPVSPHMLFDRSLVLSSAEHLDIAVESERPVDLVIDGQVFATLDQGDTVSFFGAEKSARFLRLEPRRFHQILKAKFGLAEKIGGSNAE